MWKLGDRTFKFCFGNNKDAQFNVCENINRKQTINLDSNRPFIGSVDIKSMWNILVNTCAADFSLLNLPKGKSLGRSKPATSSYNAQAPQHTVWETSTISKPYWTAFSRNKMSTTNVSELGYLFHDKSSLHIIAWDLDVERSQLYNIVLDDVKAGMMSMSPGILL